MAWNPLPLFESAKGMFWQKDPYHTLFEQRRSQSLRRTLLVARSSTCSILTEGGAVGWHRFVHQKEAV